MSREPGRFTPLATTHDYDARRMAPGLRERNDGHTWYPDSTHWVEGNGLAPLGWEPWDYEQEKGYRRVNVGPAEYAWGRYAEEVEWSPEEIGMHCFDTMDEQEDELTGVMPMRATRWARDWDFEGPPLPYPSVKMDQTLSSDPHILSYERERKAEAKRQRQEDEDAERRKSINEERRNITAMQRAAREKVLERVAEGKDGRYEVHVRKSHQTLKWEYTIRDGKAYIHLKSTGWVRLAERRGHAS